ncbi:MAG: cell division protein FtsX [Acidimicrobiales bacterium]
MISPRYAIRETGQNLWRNFLLAIATIITVGVSLAMVGGFFLTQLAASNATQRWEGGIEFVVWMNPDATPEQDDRIRARIDESPAVKDWTYVDKAEAFEEFKDIFADTPELIDVVTAEELPPSYRIVPVDPDADVVEEMGQQFLGQPGVRTVVFASDAVREIQSLADRLRIVLGIGSLLLLGAAALLILTNLSIAINNRRQEIEIMRVVGATSWFIRVPFMLEGLIQGLLGAALAIGSNYLIRIYVIDQFNQGNALQLLAGFRVEDSELLQTNVIVVAISAIVSVVGSGVAVTRYLNR